MTLVARELTFSYPRGKPVVRGVCFEVASGAVTAIVGPNAAGKTTLVRLLAGLLAPAVGAVSLGASALPVHRMTASERARAIAVVMQRPSAAFGHTLRDVVAFGAFAAGGASRAGKAVQHALEAVGLADRGHTPFETLSAGQQQRGALARALVQLGSHRESKPRGHALLADEPTSAQDPAEVVRVASILRDLAHRGVAVGVVLHDLTLAARVADRVLLLDGSGTPQMYGPVGEVLVPERLRAVFGVDFERVEAAGGPAILRAERSSARYPVGG